MDRVEDGTQPMRRRDKKRAEEIVTLLDDMQEEGDGLNVLWRSDDTRVWEVTFVHQGVIFSATHASLEYALSWAYEQAEQHEEARGV